MGDPAIRRYADALDDRLRQVADGLQGYLRDRVEQLGCPDPERYELSAQLVPMSDQTAERGRER